MGNMLDKNSLYYMYLNIRSLPAHVDHFNNFIDENNVMPDIFSLCEAWLTTVNNFA